MEEFAGKVTPAALPDQGLIHISITNRIHSEFQQENVKRKHIGHVQPI